MNVYGAPSPPEGVRDRLTLSAVVLARGPGSAYVSAGLTIQDTTCVSVRRNASVTWTVALNVPGGASTVPLSNPAGLSDRPVGREPLEIAQVNTGTPVPSCTFICRLTSSPTALVWLPGATTTGAL